MIKISPKCLLSPIGVSGTNEQLVPFEKLRSLNRRMNSVTPLMPKVNYGLVAKNLNLPISPSLFTWDSVVKSLNSINLPQDHKSQNACSLNKVPCAYPPGELNAGVPRVLMPEVNKQVLEKLRGSLPFTEHTMKVKDLASSYVAQREILYPKIQGMAMAYKEQTPDKNGRVYNILDNTWYVATASDGKKVIIDGHHGWGALNLLLNMDSIDPEADVKVVDFSDTPETVIAAAFYKGNAHSNPFRNSLVVRKTGGRRRQIRRKKTRRLNRK